MPGKVQKKVKGKNARLKQFNVDGGAGGGDSEIEDNDFVDPAELDIEAAKAMQHEIETQQDAEAAEAMEDGEAKGEEDAEEGINTDPWLMKDAAYIQKDTRWRNKQRNLVFCSRGVTSQFRHLLEDVRALMPHHKTEPKFEKRQKLHDINEVCELKSCNNAVFFESRRNEDLYMWVARVPSGPSMKFQVLNIHTTKEIRLAGNCLLGSRPILHFDKHFDEISFLKLTKSLFTQVFGTPRNHPKSKPFHDHIMCFYWMDKKIWFRHYQITPETPADRDDPEKQSLTEIGPRFVLDPIRYLDGSFSGQTLYANAHYMSPTALRVQAKKLLGNPYKRRVEARIERKEKIAANREPEDPTDEAFM